MSLWLPKKNIPAVSPSVQSLPPTTWKVNRATKDYSFCYTGAADRNNKAVHRGYRTVPPIYSAIKKKAWLCTNWQEEVWMYNRSQENNHPFFWDNKDWSARDYFKVCCSTGTYIRSLANDFGAALGCGGYLQPAPYKDRCVWCSGRKSGRVWEKPVQYWTMILKAWILRIISKHSMSGIQFLVFSIQP